MLLDLLLLVVFGLVAYWLVTTFFPQPAQMVALVVVGIVLLFWLLNIFGVFGSVDSRLIR